MFLWGTWVRVVEFGSSALHHHIWRESLLWLPGTNRYWTEWFFMTVDYDLICPGHNTSRVASSTQWCVPQVLGADTGPNALISQLLSCYLDPLFRLFWRRTLIIGPLSGTSKNTSGYCKRLNNTPTILSFELDLKFWSRWMQASTNCMMSSLALSPSYDHPHTTGKCFFIIYWAYWKRPKVSYWYLWAGN